MEIHVEGARARTEGLDELGHLEMVADAGDATLVEGAVAILERLSEVVAGGIKRFSDGERLSFGAALIELREVDGALELWEPEGEGWRAGIARGVELVEETRRIAEEHEVEEDAIELNLVCSVSPGVGTSERVTMRRRAPYSNHSGWEIVAAEDEGNPACLAHPTLASLWKREEALLPYACLPTGVEVRWSGADVEVGYPRSRPTPVWEEPDEVWAHHDPSRADEIDWMVSGRLSPSRPGVPTWEWLPLRRTGADTGVVCAVPFLLHGLALGDEVRVNRHGVVVERVRASGHVALRAEFVDGHDGEVVEELRERGVSCEWMNDAILAIDCESDRAAAELMELLEGSDECSVVSHSLPLRPRPLTETVRAACTRAGLGFGVPFALLCGLWIEEPRLDRIGASVAMAIAFTILVWIACASRAVITAFDVRHPSTRALRVGGVWGLCTGLVVFIASLVAVGTDVADAAIVGVIVGIACALVSHERDGSPIVAPTIESEVPPPFYRYASARTDEARVEILVSPDGAAQAVVSTEDGMRSRSYPSLYSAAAEISTEHDVGRGSWWYAR